MSREPSVLRTEGRLQGGDSNNFTVRVVPSCRQCNSLNCTQGWNFLDNMTCLLILVILASLLSAKISYECYKKWDAQEQSNELRNDLRVEKMEESLNIDAFEQKVDNLHKTINEKSLYIGNLEKKVVDLQKDVQMVQNSILRIEQTLVNLDTKLKEEKPAKIVENVQSPKFEYSKMYELDKTGKADYALSNSGGFVLSTRNTKTYNVGSGTVSIFGVPVLSIKQEPRFILQKDVSPGECWPFEGEEGTVMIHLATKIFVTHVTLEHIPIELSPTGKLDTAPRGFSFWGLTCQSDKDPHCFGHFEYDINGPPVQTFEVKEKSSVPYCIVEFTVYSNHGHPNYTCIYRIRVHGKPSDETLNAKAKF